MKKKIIDILLFILDWTWCFLQTFIWYHLSRYWFDNLAPAEGFGAGVIPWIKEHEAKWRVKIYLVTPKSKYEHWFLQFISGFGCGRFICLPDAIPNNGKVDDVHTVGHENGHVITGRIIGLLFLLVIILSPLFNLIGRWLMKKGWTWLKMAKWYYNLPWEWIADKLGKVNRKEWLKQYA